MNRVALLVTISAALALVVVACGEKEEEASTPTTTAEPPQPEVAPAEPEAAPEPPEPEPEAEATAGAGTGEDQTDLDCESADVDCPMFEWMEANTKQAVEDGDVEAMAVAFHKIEFMTPVPEWDSEEHGDNAWVKLSRRGAELAEQGNAREARRLCKGCHDQWRDPFREQGFRTAPMVELPENAAEGRQDL